jgi:hypothetical protein
LSKDFAGRPRAESPPYFPFGPATGLPDQVVTTLINTKIPEGHISYIIYDYMMLIFMDL